MNQPLQSQPAPPPGGQFLAYRTEDGKLKLAVRFDGETVWLTQKMMGLPYDVATHTIDYRLKKPFTDSDLVEDSVIRNFRITAADGKSYETRSEHIDPVLNMAGCP